VLYGYQNRTAPFASDGHSLQEPEGDEEESARTSRCAHKVGSRPMPKVANPHADQRYDQHRLSTHSIAEVPHQDATERTTHEADAKSGEGGECRGHG